LGIVGWEGAPWLIRKRVGADVLISVEVSPHNAGRGTAAKKRKNRKNRELLRLLRLFAANRFVVYPTHFSIRRL